MSMRRSSFKKTNLVNELLEMMPPITVFPCAAAGWMLYFSTYYLLPTAHALYISALNLTKKQNPSNPFAISKINFFTAFFTVLDCLITLPTLVAAGFCLDGTLRAGIYALKEVEPGALYTHPSPHPLRPLPIRITNFFLAAIRQFYRPHGQIDIAIFYFASPALFVGSGYLLYGAGSALFGRFKPAAPVTNDKATSKPQR